MRRNVKFNHRGNNAPEGRRPSIPEISEGALEPGSSPAKHGLNGRAEVGKEEVQTALFLPESYFFSKYR